MLRLRDAHYAVLLGIFGAIGMSAGFGGVPQPCRTLAKKVGASYVITCPLDSNCFGSLCDLGTTETPDGRYRHFCRCDDGSPSTDCNGYMLSDDMDPTEPGVDVFCFETDTCNQPTVCDENQIGASFSVLCECK